MELYITEREVREVGAPPRRFRYYLTVDSIEAGNFCCENYGVRITEAGVRSACVPALTTSAVRIDQLMTTLIDHAVGPIGLDDVIQDWL